MVNMMGTCKNMKTIYIVFDKVPQKEDGGLVATYINLIKEFKDVYKFKFVSVFPATQTNIPEFKDIDIITLSSIPINNQFPHAVSFLKRKQFLRTFSSLLSAIYFFLFIPIGRLKTRNILCNQLVIASSPAAAIFLSSRIEYILEIHSSYHYFWESGPLGKAQVSLIPHPALTLFRTETDAHKAPPCLNPNFIHNAVEEPAYRTKNKANRPKALFVGRLTPLKNPQMLLRCAQAVQQVIPDFTLDIYGTGELQNELETSITQLGLNNIVSLKGHTDDKGIYSDYDLLWLTSLDEGFGLVIIEAMANKTPTISTYWGDAVYEIIDDQNSGIVAISEEDFIEQSVRLLQDDTLLNKMSQKAYLKFTNDFTQQQHRTKMQEYIESFI